MDDWRDVSACPLCGAKPAWHEKGEGYAVHCTDGLCPMSAGVEAPTLPQAVALWEAAAHPGGTC